MTRSRLHERARHGQGVWIHNLSRDLLRSGALAPLMREDAVVGVTSNPTIFQKAIATDDLGPARHRPLVVDGELDDEETNEG